MTATDTRRPGIRTGSFAPCRAGGFAGNHLTHSSFMPAKSASSRRMTVALATRSSDVPAAVEDGGHILQALPGLLLDRLPDDLPAHRILRPRAGDKHKTRCPYRLAVCRRWGRGVGRADDVSCHEVLQCCEMRGSRLHRATMLGSIRTHIGSQNNRELWIRRLQRLGEPAGLGRAARPPLSPRPSWERAAIGRGADDCRVRGLGALPHQALHGCNWQSPCP